jgi:uncharacterized protein
MTNLIIGLAAGVLAGLFGIGGGILIVPALIFFSRMSQTAAQGTSLGALLLPVGALGAWEYYKKGDLQIAAAALLALGIFLGAPAGARLALAIPVRMLQRGFAVFLVVVAARLWWKA